MMSKTNMMSHVSNEQLTNGTTKSPESAITLNTNKKSDNGQNLMLSVYLSIKSNKFTDMKKYLSFTGFDLCYPLKEFKC